MKTCPVCQQSLTDTAKFCYFCGASLLETAPEAPAPAVEEETVPNPSDDPIESIADAFDVPEAEPVSADEPAFEDEPAVLPEIEAEPDVVPAHVPEPKPEKSQYRSGDEPQVIERAPEPILIATDSRSLMTTAGYIFTTLLFHVPLIGLIFMIIWGCGKTKNISRKRFSLAFLIMRLICYILVLAAAVFLLVCFSGLFSELWEAVKPILFA